MKRPASTRRFLAVIDVMATATEPAVKEAMDKQNLGYAVADGEVFRKQIAADSTKFSQLVDQMGAKTP